MLGAGVVGVWASISRYQDGILEPSARETEMVLP